MSKINIGATLALYPCPVIVVGAMVNERPTLTLVAHAGTVAHSHLMVSLVQAHYINQGIRESKRLSVNVVDESWLAKADRMGTVSGNKVDKSGEFAWTMGENGAPLIDEAKVSIECEVDGNYELEHFDHFICKILATYADEEVLNEQGKIDYHAFKPVLFGATRSRNVQCNREEGRVAHYSIDPHPSGVTPPGRAELATAPCDAPGTMRISPQPARERRR